MTIEVPQPKRLLRKQQSVTIVTADSIRDLSAYRYMLFNQAWVREVNIGGDFYGTESHLARMGVFLNHKNYEAVGNEFTNLVLHLRNLANDPPQNLLAATLAPLVISIGEKEYDAVSEDGLRETAHAILMTGISQAALQEAVEQSKKKLSAELSLAYPARFGGKKRDTYAEAVSERLGVEIEAALSDTPEDYDVILEEMQNAIVQMLAPSTMHPDHPKNILLTMEAAFAGGIAELEHGGYQAEGLSVYNFWYKLQFLEKKAAATPKRQ